MFIDRANSHALALLVWELPPRSIAVAAIFMKRLFLLCSLVTLATALDLLAAPGDVDLSFEGGSGISGKIFSIVEQPDARLIIGGNFTAVRDAAQVRIARLETDGRGDSTFNPGAGANDQVNCVALQSDGKVVIGGNFSKVNNVSRGRIARVNADGSLDTSFNPGTGADGSVAGVAVQTDGRVVVVGSFTTISGTSRNGIARLNADGSLDTTFDTPGTEKRQISAVVIQPDGMILVAGLFFNNGAIGTTASYLARLNTDGTLDPSFNPPSDSGDAFRLLALQADGRILVGGTHIARLNSDGSRDTSFNASTDNFINSIALQADGKVLIVGVFTSVNGSNGGSIARLNSDGTLDSTFSRLPGQFDRVAALSDGQIMVSSGVFLHRLNTDGTVDPTFVSSTAANDGVYSTIAQADGKALLGGRFTTIGGISRNCIARLNTDGTLDTSFDPGTGMEAGNEAQGWVLALAVQKDGKIVVGGWFGKVNGVARRHVARLNPDGSLDSSFNPGAGPDGRNVECLAVQADGKILIGGNFNTVDGIGRIGVARLNPNGSVDTSFTPATAGEVTCLALPGSGKILASEGGFIVRFNSDGTLDPAFSQSTSANHLIRAMLLQPDGKILFGGDFTSVNGSTRNFIARKNSNGTLDTGFTPSANSLVFALALQSDGKILAAGDFSTMNGTARKRVARLNSDGSLDRTFNPGAGPDGTVDAMFEQPDGKPVIAGFFTSVNGIPRVSVARLLGDVLVTSGSMPSGTYSEGQNLDLTLNFDGPVMVDASGGTPRIRLKIGPETTYADYLGGSGSAVLVFRHTITAGEGDYNGIEIFSPIDLNGGAIRGTAGENAVLTFTPPDSSGILVDNGDHAPVAPDFSMSRPAGQPAKLTVADALSHASDPDNDPLTLAVSSPTSAGGTAHIEGSWLIYSPPASDSADSFSYQVTDPFGRSAAGTISVTIQPPDTSQSENILAVQHQGDQIVINFAGIPGIAYTVQYTTDLSNPQWQDLAVLTAPSNGLFEYRETASGETRFYRTFIP